MIDTLYALIMDPRSLEAFVALAEELHFGRAAERLHLAQPPFSRRIQGLEEELGLLLFERSSRRVELTAEGSSFLPEARGALDRLRRAKETAAALARGEAGTLRLGFVAAAMDGPLPWVLKAFRGRWPGVELDLRELGSPAQLAALRAGDLDVGLLRLGVEKTADAVDIETPGGSRGASGEAQSAPDGFESAIFLRERYVLALPEGHALAGREDLRLRDLEDEPFLFFPRRVQPALHDAFMARFAELGFRPRLTQEVRGRSTALALVAAGLGLTLVPSEPPPRPGVLLRPLADALPGAAISLVWRTVDARRALPRNFLDLAMGNDARD